MRLPPIAAAAALVSTGILLGLSHSRASTDAVPVTPLVRTQAFELVDAKGTVRAALNVESNGEVLLRLRDATGTIRVKLGASAEGSALLLLDRATEPGVHMVVRGSEATVTLKDGTGAQRTLRP